MGLADPLGRAVVVLEFVRRAGGVLAEPRQWALRQRDIIDIVADAGARMERSGMRDRPIPGLRFAPSGLPITQRPTTTTQRPTRMKRTPKRLAPLGVPQAYVAGRR